MSDFSLPIKKAEPWWFSSIDVSVGYADIARAALIRQAIWTGAVVHNGWHRGSLRNKNAHEIASLFREQFPSFKPFLHLHGKRSDETVRTIILSCENAVCTLEDEDDGDMLTQVWSLSESFMKDWRKFCAEQLPTVPQPGVVEAIVRPAPDKPLRIVNVGRLHAKLEPDNYSDEVLEGYRTIVKDILSPHPEGRIGIFDGPPGTGKTYLLRAITQDAPGARFVIVSSDLITAIGGPEMINLLAENQTPSTKKEQKTVLLVEDADMLLNKRKANNMAAIANALNIGDGLMGEVFKLFIVATSNTPIKQIDEALQRPGRLSRLVSVGHLPIEKAAKVFSRLVPNKEPTFTSPMTLAEIYQAARRAGWDPGATDAPTVSAPTSTGEGLSEGPSQNGLKEHTLSEGDLKRVRGKIREYKKAENS